METQTQNSLSTALDLIRRGFYVFPLVPGTKRPILSNGVKGASNDEKNVRNWFESKGPVEKNIGIACRNIVVVDVDVKDGEGNGAVDTFSLSQVGLSAQNNSVVTPRGGTHFYFKRPKEDVIGRAGIRIEGIDARIDVRIGDQYVVSENSTVGGKRYRRQGFGFNVDDLPELPLTLLEELPKRNEPKITQVASAPTFANVDCNKAAYRCRRYVEKIPPAVQGDKGQVQFFKVCNVIFNGFALDREVGMEILREYNARCLPPWDFDSPRDFRWITHAVDKAISSPLEPRGNLLDTKGTQFMSYDYVSPTTEETFNNLVREMEEALRSNEKNSKEEAMNNYGVIPAELLTIPGFIDECLATMKKCATAYNHHACFTGAVGLLSTLMGPKFMCHGLMPNLYMIATSASGSGKETFRKFNRTVLDLINRPEVFGRTFTSGEAIEDAFVTSPVKLFMIDECDILFGAMANGKESYQASMQRNLLEMYSSAGEPWVRRTKAKTVKDSAPEIIYNWFLTIVGTSPKTSYYESLNKRMINGGMFGRLLIVNSPGYDYKAENEGVHADDIPPSIIDQALWFSEYAIRPGNQVALMEMSGTFAPKRLPLTDEAKAKACDYQNRIEKLKRSLPDDDEGIQSVYARAAEKVFKFAAIYAVSKNLKELNEARMGDGQIDYDEVNRLLVVDVDAIEWATKFVDAVIKTQLFDLSLYSFTTSYEKYSNEVYEVVLKESRRTKSGLVERSRILNAVKAIKVSEVDAYLNDLTERNRIAYGTRKGNNGRTYEGYFPLKDDK